MWVVVVEPYFDGSHRAWAEGYQAHSGHDVDLVTHRGSFWKWRMHGAALTLADELRNLVAERGCRPDAVIVSDMVDGAALGGLAADALEGVPVVAFFHENQLTYPLAPRALPDLTYAMKNWLTMAAADEVWFNSAHHRDEIARALPPLLGSMPDHRHLDHVDGVLDRCWVAHVGIDVGAIVTDDRSHAVAADGPPLVLWNQRWEYDKNPVRFFAAIDRAADAGIDFRLAVAGQRFGTSPPVFDRAAARHAERIEHWGEAERPVYCTLLRRADVVVSTARHEFFGIAVAEAMAAGCVPVLPDDLSYPELVGRAHRHLLYRDDDELDRRLVAALTGTGTFGGALATDVAERFGWERVASRYDERLDALVERGPISC